MPEQFDTHNATPAFDHDSTLVVALELSGKCRAGLWLQDAAVKIGPALPGSQATPRMGHRGTEPTGSAGYELAGLRV